jgi:N-acetylglucosamine kinase-like BadF-type ATPase
MCTVGAPVDRFRHGGKFLAAACACQWLIYGHRVATSSRADVSGRRAHIISRPGTRTRHASRRPRRRLVVGVDAGGTSTRCVITTLDGTPVGRGHGGGANQHSSTGDPAESLATALKEALYGVDPGEVAGGVLGIAGAGGAGLARARQLADTAWLASGLTGSPTVVSDIVVAFASGTTAPSGIVLIAGTGAVAAAIEDGAVSARCDGYGWLLGDEGSAVWLGREGVRAALAAGDGRGEPTGLAEAIPRALLGRKRPRDPADIAQAVVRTIYGGAPADLGRLAPVVCGQSAAGDAVARNLTDMAAERLLAAVGAVRPHPGWTGPIVLAGSVLSSGPVADAVRAGLAREHGDLPLAAEDGALGAATLAIREFGGNVLDEGVRDRLLTAVGTAA